MQILIIITQMSTFADHERTGLMNIIILLGLTNAMVKGVRLKYSFSQFTIQSTLSKADTLGTKATVRFREVSALERVQLQRYKCNSAGSGQNLLSGLESVRLERVDCIAKL